MSIEYNDHLGMYIYPWTNELISFFGARLSHFFVLYFNIHDHFLLDKDSFVSLEDYLFECFVNKYEYELFLPYSQSSGFKPKRTVDSDRLQQTFRILAKREISGRGEGAPRNEARSLDKIVRDYYSKSVEQPAKPDRALPVIEKLLKQAPESADVPNKIVIILHFLEKLVPAQKSDPVTLETLQRLALDPEIAGTDNVIIGITSDIGMVEPSLFGFGSRCRAIRIPLPDKSEKEVFFNILMQKEDDDAEKLAKLSDDFGRPDDAQSQISSLSNLTSGFSLADCDSLNKLAKYEAYVDGREFKEACIEFQDVKEMKRDLIKEGSRDLLEEVEAERGFQAIGGLGKIKHYLESIAEKLKVGSVGQKRALPKGILLAGPPGTGKTILAEALAKEGKLNMVKMGNIRSMWVGESERNLSRALHLIEDLAPVLVFVDEIDQAFGGRGLGMTGDSGVSQRIFSKILEYMGSDRYRGKILWVAATNRPDILDEAMVRRFDRVIPVLMPNKDARKDIFDKMPYNLKGFVYNDDVDLDKAAESTKRLTGSDIQVILTRAIESSVGSTQDGVPTITQNILDESIEKFIQNHNEQMYELQTLTSVRFCNFKDMLPELDEIGENIKEIISARLEGNNNPLEMRIRELQQNLYLRRIS